MEMARSGEIVLRIAENKLKRMTTALEWIEARNGIMFAVRISEEMILQGVEDDGSWECQ